MLPPTDYPQKSESSPHSPTDITYAALLDRAAAEQPITDEMIREACVKMEAAQQYPFANKDTQENLDEVAAAPIKQLLTKLRSVKPAIKG